MFGRSKKASAKKVALEAKKLKSEFCTVICHNQISFQILCIIMYSYTINVNSLFSYNSSMLNKKILLKIINCGVEFHTAIIKYFSLSDLLHFSPNAKPAPDLFQPQQLPAFVFYLRKTSYSRYVFPCWTA